jgi:hypothetical protein
MTRTLFAWPRHWFKRALKRKRYAYCGFLESEEALDRFLTTFFNQSLPKAEWGHTAHVAMAASLLYGSDVETVLPRVRQALRTYIEALGGRNDDECGYHETLTVFWLKAISAKLRELRPASRLEAARDAVAAFGEARKLHTRYYSQDLNSDLAARRGWVEPDLRAI